ncbi:MAG: ATP-binding protein, partial [Deltaproteobacteria bacterium]|nr:ATP-binding protein [Deltaproteobacteria bacterium]
GDIAKWGKQEKILKQVLRTALKKQGTSLSWDSFAKEAEIKSHATVSSYIEDLEKLYVLFVQYHLDLTKKIPDFNKNKKISFFDPFIYHLFNRLFYFRDHEINPSLVEAVSVIHFTRHFKDLCSGPGRSFSDFVFYHKNRREADIVVKTWKGGEKEKKREKEEKEERKEELFALEVKYQNKIIKDDRKSLLPFGKGVIISKDTLKQDEKYPVIPVHMLLASIE